MVLLERQAALGVKIQAVCKGLLRERLASLRSETEWVELLEEGIAWRSG